MPDEIANREWKKKLTFGFLSDLQACNAVFICSLWASLAVYKHCINGRAYKWNEWTFFAEEMNGRYDITSANICRRYKKNKRYSLYYCMWNTNEKRREVMRRFFYIFVFPIFLVFPFLWSVTFAIYFSFSGKKVIICVLKHQQNKSTY